ncbi:hypothetical protein LTR09_005541 [Extremus antarcticus]|uniref:Uncharacterized protein n=1 Tax=Extremus antarcticus TaxID=702011 RepID=A0AAJ0GCA5_9PEZI|nr:hypothetical protein LTR09_005541 [Extremus antarcticus]
MKLIIATFALALGLATAAPLDARRQVGTTTATGTTATAASSGVMTIETISVSSVPAPSYSATFGTGVPSSGFPFATGTGFPYPTGVFPTGVFPTGTGFPLPTGTGLAGNPYASLPTCPENGALVCNGETEFGICNWGHVLFVPVAQGTRCVDGKIV